MLKWLCLAGLMTVLPGCDATRGGRDEGSASPLQRLQAGNERFVTGAATHPHLDSRLRRQLATKGQHPFATVLACSDSRVPVELLFDQGLGDLFVIRVAGNVSAGDETGSVEYAVEHLQCPMVVVLGHRQCGAVTAAVHHEQDTPSILSLLSHIEPAVERVRREHPQLHGDELIAKAVEQNVWHSIEDLYAASPLIQEAVRKGNLELIGGVYDIVTGHVRWMGPHPQQDELVSAHRDPGTP